MSNPKPVHITTKGIREIIADAIRRVPILAQRVLENASPPLPIWRAYLVAARAVQDEKGTKELAAEVFANPDLSRVAWDKMANNWMLYVARERERGSSSYSGRMVAVELFDPFDYELSTEPLEAWVLPQESTFPVEWESRAAFDIDLGEPPSATLKT
ncbi:hypothetical protein [Actinacidiphila oryziradicis]|uniref:hypothetical protein n=1 Tax=Actinacidiphila oryziradicis TaxID=2571141 RepID=UPI0023F51CDC|nr:hypothetical protein [Actinacidiphila oryziradicis]